MAILLFILSLIVLGAILIIGLRNLDYFLNLTRPITSETMIMEGWVPDYMKKEICQHYWRGQYKRLIVTGGPIMQGFFLSEYRTYANLGAATMIALGIDPHEVVAVSAPLVDSYRTAAAASSLKAYMLNLGIASCNIYTLGSHARRSYFIFRQVLGPDIAVGIIAMPDDRYRSDRWWSTSIGFRMVIAEALAYFYMRLIPLGK